MKVLDLFWSRNAFAMFVWIMVLVMPMTCRAQSREYPAFNWLQLTEVSPEEGRLLLDVQVLSAKEGNKARQANALWLRDHAILMHQTKIAAVIPMRAFKNAPAWVQKIPRTAGQGAYAIPGLIDTHVHVWDEAELLSFLSFGVTTIRNASGMPFHLQWAKEIEAGKILGPRLLTTGPILNGRGPNTQINHQIVETASEARAAVKAQYEMGYRQLKVYSNLSLEAYEAILEQARALGMTVMGHTPEGGRSDGVPFKKPFQIPFLKVLADGLSSIEHVESIVWHGLSDQLSMEKMSVLAKQIAAHRQSVTPTLIAHDNLRQVAKTKGVYLKRPGVELLNPFITETEQESYAHWSGQSAALRERYAQFYLRATKSLFDAGVRLVAGTDAGIFTNIPGQSLLDELDILVQAGLTPYQALLCATRNAAQVLGLSNQIGQIAPGFQADLLVLTDDPGKSLQALRKPVGVVLAGRWMDESAMRDWRLQGAKASFEKTQERVMKGLQAQGQVAR